MTMGLPKISIITPSYNQARFLEQTIQSVLDQGYPNLEYIVVDGGSTDGSVEIIKKYADKLTWWVSEKDRGQSHAINKGLERATGDVLAYLNSDDWYLPGILSEVGRHFSLHADTGILHGKCVWAREDGTRLGTDGAGVPIDVHMADIRNLEDILDLWRVWWNRRNFVQPEVFWSRAVARSNGAFDESLHYCMDFDYWMRALAHGAKVAALDREVACFRFHGAQKTADREASYEEVCALARKRIEDPGMPLEIPVRKRLLASWLYHHDLAGIERKSEMGGAPRWLRLARVAGYTLTHPQVCRAPAFKDRLFRRGSRPS